MAVAELDFLAPCAPFYERGFRAAEKMDAFVQALPDGQYAVFVEDL